MKPRVRTYLALALCLGTAPSEASPREQVYCADRLIGAGMFMSDVLALCGTPASIERHELRVPKKTKIRKCPWTLWGEDAAAKARCKAYKERHRRGHIAVQVWHYDLGPDRFKRALTFHEWWLVNVETNGNVSDD